LNYRLAGDSSVIIQEIAKAAQASAQHTDGFFADDMSDQRMTDDVSSQYSRPPETPSQEGNWLQERYSAMEVGARRLGECQQWRALLRNDELLQMQGAGQILHGFKEDPISFPPTYRRVRGPDGDCWDYTDPQRLALCYTIRIGSGGASSYTDYYDDEGDNEMAWDDDRDDITTAPSCMRTRIRVPSYTDRIW